MFSHFQKCILQFWILSMRNNNVTFTRWLERQGWFRGRKTKSEANWNRENGKENKRQDKRRNKSRSESREKGAREAEKWKRRTREIKLELEQIPKEKQTKREREKKTIEITPKVIFSSRIVSARFAKLSTRKSVFEMSFSLNISKSHLSHFHMLELILVDFSVNV